MPEEKLFDTQKPFIVEIHSGTVRRAELKYPTDDQWIDRIKKRKILKRDIGRGKFKVDSTPLEREDEAIFKNRLISAELEFDEYEASMVIDRLAKAEVLESELIEGDHVRVKLGIFGGVEASFVLKNPRRKQVVEYGRAAVHTTHSEQGSDTDVTIAPSAQLFGALLVSQEGYAEGSAIPIVHKDAVVVEVIRRQNPEAQSPA